MRRALARPSLGRMSDVIAAAFLQFLVDEGVTESARTVCRQGVMQTANLPVHRQPAGVCLCVCILLLLTGATGALKKCQNQEWPKSEVSELRELVCAAPVYSNM